MITIRQTTDPKLLASLNKDIQELHARLYPEDFKHYDPDRIAEGFRELLKIDHSYAFVARLGAESAGYLHCFIRERPENAFQYPKRLLYIDQVCVLPYFRKQGVARALFDHAIQFAKELDIPTLELHYWEANREAAAVFQKIGFEPENQKMVRQLG